MDENKIESITKVLNENQIYLFKINHCYICEKYSDTNSSCCQNDDDTVSSVIISCVENEKFIKKVILNDTST